MAIVKVRKGQVTIPTRVRTRLGIVDGDVLNVQVRSNHVVLTPADEPQRKTVDEQVAEGLEDLRKGRVHGPFRTVDELERSMRAVGKGSRSKP